MNICYLAQRLALIGLLALASRCGPPQGDHPAAMPSPQNECEAGLMFNRSLAMQPGECGAGEILAQGSIVRILGVRFTYDGPLNLGEYSAARVVIWGSHGDVRGDASAEVIAEQIIAPIRSLPIAYCVTGSLSRAATFRQVGIDGEVRQRADRHTVGDLIEESFHEVSIPSRQDPINVTGMESCQDPNAGGYCLCD